MLRLSVEEFGVQSLIEMIFEVSQLLDGGV
jgi:hypothetical protein